MCGISTYSDCKRGVHQGPRMQSDGIVHERIRMVFVDLYGRAQPRRIAIVENGSTKGHQESRRTTKDFWIGSESFLKRNVRNDYRKPADSPNLVIPNPTLRATPLMRRDSESINAHEYGVKTQCTNEHEWLGMDVKEKIKSTHQHTNLSLCPFAVDLFSHDQSSPTIVSFGIAWHGNCERKNYSGRH